MYDIDKEEEPLSKQDFIGRVDAIKLADIMSAEEGKVEIPLTCHKKTPKGGNSGVITLACEEPVAMAVAVGLLRQKLEPVAIEQGMTWKDIGPTLGHAGHISTIRDAVHDPHAFLEHMHERAGPTAARKLAAAKLRPMLEPMLRAQVWGVTIQY